MVNANRGATGFLSNEFEQEYDRPSKSQLKREMIALQKLGEQLVDEPRDRVLRAPLPEALREAILACQRVKAHEGRRRQLQYVGRLMRDLDAEQLAALQKTIDSWKGLSRAETAALHALEKEREKLLANDAAVTDLIARFPELDAQHLRNLIRNARKELAQDKPPKAYREIFQVLKNLPLSATTTSMENPHAFTDNIDE
jgi:ribosome-associated protein